VSFLDSFLEYFERFILVTAVLVAIAWVGSDEQGEPNPVSRLFKLTKRHFLAWTVYLCIAAAFSAYMVYDINGPFLEHFLLFILVTAALLVLAWAVNDKEGPADWVPRLFKLTKRSLVGWTIYLCVAALISAVFVYSESKRIESGPVPTAATRPAETPGLEAAAQFYFPEPEQQTIPNPIPPLAPSPPPAPEPPQ